MINHDRSNRSRLAKVAMFAVAAGALTLAGCSEEKTEAPESMASGSESMSESIASSESASTLAAVKARGEVYCGVSTGLAGFSIADSTGAWSGIDVDLCRAIAAAVLGNDDKVKFVPLNASQRFTALQSGEVDVLVRNTTWTATRDTQLGLMFAGVNFYDGQGFMVPVSLVVSSAYDLDGATVCVQTGTTTEKNLSDFFRSNGLRYKPVVFEGQEESIKAYASGRCNVYTTDASGLAAHRANDVGNPSDHVILPELISKEPLGAVVRRGDDDWFSIVKWVHFAMLNAEEMSINSGNVDSMLNDDSPAVQRLLGTGGNDFGKDMGIDNRWAYRVIKQVGNYGEVYERNVGPDTPIGLERGLNALWVNGGLQYGPPVR